jgi:hypothetical protein
MRSVINTIANVTTSGMSRNQVRTAVAGVDTVRNSLRHLRLYAAPAHQRWGQFAGKQKPASGCVLSDKTQAPRETSDSLSRSSREPSRRRRPRESSCLGRCS